MSKHVFGALFLFLVICGGVFTFSHFKNKEETRTRKQTSLIQEAKGTIRIGGDGYAGYFPLFSEEMKARLLQEGYRLEFQDDAGDYALRTKKLRAQDIDLAVFTIDSYLLNGAEENYPGSIIAVLSESKGSDAIVARKEKIDSLNALKEQPQTKITFTENSPSHHLLKAVGVHFGLPHLLQTNSSWARTTAGSQESLSLLQNDSADVAVLWEPEITRALADDRFVKILGTESTSGLIVDVLVANRTTIQEQPAMLEVLLKEYLFTLQTYRKDQPRFLRELAQWTNVSDSQAKTLMEGIRWTNLYENSSAWFGVESNQYTPAYRLFKSIESTMDILLKAKDFKENPLPNKDGRTIIYDNLVKKLTFFHPAEEASLQQTDQPTIVFSPLSDAAWEQLRAVGTLEIPPVQFQKASLALSDFSKNDLRAIIQTINQYPRFRISVEGHTSPQGDSQANVALSQSRAEAVADFLTSEFSIDVNRIRAVGFGSEKPLSRLPNESYRSYMNRLGRVEIKLLTDPL